MLISRNLILSLALVLLGFHAGCFAGLHEMLVEAACMGKDRGDEKSPLLILISLKGFRWHNLENHSLPVLKKYFVEQGVKVDRGLQNLFSTRPFPNYWKIVAGFYRGTHGKCKKYQK